MSANRFPSGVIIVSPGGERFGGGIGTVTKTIVEGLSGKTPPVPVYVVDPRGGGSVFHSLWKLPISLVTCCWLRVFSRCRVFHIQVSERLSFARKWPFMMLGRVTGARVVLHHHGAEFVPWVSGASPAWRRLVRACVHAADVNIVLGDAWRRCLIETFGVAPERIVVLPNAVADIGGEVGRLRKRLQKRPGEIAILMLANLSPRKGVSELLQAVRNLQQKGHPIRLVCAGGGDIDRYRAEAARLELDDAEFPGWLSRTEVTTHLAQADLLVLPSHNEGLPIAILESTSAGVPVVGTPVGAIPEFFRHGSDMLLVQPGNVPELEAAIESLVTSADARQTLATTARKTFERHFQRAAFDASLMAAYGMA